MNTKSTIAEQVASYHRASAGQLPPDITEAFATDQRDLAAAGNPSGVVEPGSQLPDGELILTAPSDGTRAAQLQLGLDLTQINADGTTGLPMPTVVIADEDGVIRWIDVHADYTTRTELGQVLQAVTETIREIAA